MSDETRCVQCGAYLTAVGGVRYFETVTKTVRTEYDAHLTADGVLVTEAVASEDELAGGGVDASSARCRHCGLPLCPPDVEYAH